MYKFLKAEDPTETLPDSSWKAKWQVTNSGAQNVPQRKKEP